MPEFIILLHDFSYNLGLLATASIVGLACVIALHHRTQSTQIFSAFTLFLYAVASGFTAIITTQFILALSSLLMKVVIFFRHCPVGIYCRQLHYKNVVYFSKTILKIPTRIILTTHFIIFRWAALLSSPCLISQPMFILPAFPMGRHIIYLMHSFISTMPVWQPTSICVIPIKVIMPICFTVSD